MLAVRGTDADGARDRRRLQLMPMSTARAADADCALVPMPTALAEPTARGAGLVRLVPIGAGADVDSQRHTQFAGAGHLVADGLCNTLSSVSADLKHQFVVYLHD